MKMIDILGAILGFLLLLALAAFVYTHRKWVKAEISKIKNELVVIGTTADNSNIIAKQARNTSDAAFAVASDTKSKVDAVSATTEQPSATVDTAVKTE